MVSHGVPPFLPRSLIWMVFLEGTTATLSALPWFLWIFQGETFTGCTRTVSSWKQWGKEPAVCSMSLTGEHGSWFPQQKPGREFGGWGWGLASINAKGGIIMKLQAVGVVVGYPPIAWNQEPKSHPRRTSRNLDGSRVRKLHYQGSNSKSVPHWRGFIKKSRFQIGLQMIVALANGWRMGGPH